MREQKMLEYPQAAMIEFPVDPDTIAIHAAVHARVSSRREAAVRAFFDITLYQCAGAGAVLLCLTIVSSVSTTPFRKADQEYFSASLRAANCISRNSSRCV